jgi:hypothetical protein
VLSHGSAAVLHGLPVWQPAVDRVHLTRSRPGGGKRRTLIDIHTSTLAQDEVITLGGIPVTSLARTVADLGRVLPFEQAVAAADRALRLGLARSDLDAALGRQAGCHGVQRSRRMAQFADPRSESVGESVSRVRCLEEMLPVPALQYEVRDPSGRLVGRADLCWPALRTLGEFDGRAKYGRLLGPADRIEDVVYREKLREDALRDLGWQVVRWTWSDLYRPGELRARLLRAFARTARHDA